MRSSKAWQLGAALIALGTMGCRGQASPPSSSADPPVEASSDPPDASSDPPDAASSDPLEGAIAGAFAFGKARLEGTIAALESAHPSDAATLFPTSTRTSGDDIGAWNLKAASDWRSGFFPGALWQIYFKTSEPTFLDTAKRWTAGLEPLQDNPIDHDLGFRFMCSFGQGYRLIAGKDDPDGSYKAHAEQVILRAAAALDTRFNMGGIPVGALRALDDYAGPYPVYMDEIMNLELLFEGWSLSGKPTSGPARGFYDHAVSSASTILAENVRADGSTYHIVQHNDGTAGTPKDGAIYAKITDQGYGNETTWSRGQAWAIYGFTAVYRYTKEDASVKPERFLAAARETADYFIAHLPHNFAQDADN